MGSHVDFIVYFGVGEAKGLVKGSGLAEDVRL